MNPIHTITNPGRPRESRQGRRPAITLTSVRCGETETRLPFLRALCSRRGWSRQGLGGRWARRRRKRRRQRGWLRRTKRAPHLNLSDHQQPARAWKNKRHVLRRLHPSARHAVRTRRRWHRDRTRAASPGAATRDGQPWCVCKPDLERRQAVVATVLPRVDGHFTHPRAGRKLHRHPRVVDVQPTHAEVPPVGVVGHTVDALGCGQVVALQGEGRVHAGRERAELHQRRRRRRWKHRRRRDGRKRGRRARRFMYHDQRHMRMIVIIR